MISKNIQKKSVGKLAVIALVSGIAIPSLLSHNPAPGAPVHIEAAYDPTEPDADTYARHAAVTIPQLRLNPRDTITVRAVDHKTTILDSAWLDEEGAYKLFTSTQQHLLPVTDLASYFTTLANTEPQSDTIVLLFSDDLDDNMPASAATIRSAAQKLASMPRVKAVILYGILRDTRPKVEGLPEMLAPLKQRLHVIPRAQMAPAEALSIYRNIRY